MLKALWLAALVAATYPIAVAAHVALDAVFGDALWLIELQHGSMRTAAWGLIDGWIDSIPWVLGFWAGAIALRAISGPRRPIELWALLAVGVGLVATILWASVQVPLQLALLLLAAAALESRRARGIWP